MVTNETKCPIYATCFFNTKSGTTHTGRELGRFAPAKTNLTFHIICSSGLSLNASTKDGAYSQVCYEATY